MLRDQLHVGASNAPIACADVASDANGVSYGGFRLSTKLLKLQALIQKEKPTDKIIIFSFFKGFLDLAEAMLEYEMGIKTERFDGDDPNKSDALERFQAVGGSARVLLATVNSGGVGLNITQANIICFWSVKTLSYLELSIVLATAVVRPTAAFPVLPARSPCAWFAVQ